MKKIIVALLMLITLVACPQTNTVVTPPAPPPPAPPPPVTTIIVSSNGDAGAGSLRQALIDVPDAGTVNLSGINGQTITLLSTLVIGKNVTITNTASIPNVAIQGGATAFQAANVRIFEIQSGKIVTLSKMTLFNGSVTATPARGGAILNAGTLTLSSLDINNSQAVGSNGGTGASGGFAQGGAIYSTGTLTLNAVTLSGNKAIGGNGGIGSAAPLSCMPMPPPQPCTPGPPLGPGGSGGAGGLAQGGAIFIATGGTLTINTATFNANSALGGNGGGGGTGMTMGFGGSGATANGGGGYKDSGTTVTSSGITNGSGGNANSVMAGINGFPTAVSPPPATVPNNNF